MISRINKVIVEISALFRHAGTDHFNSVVSFTYMTNMNRMIHMTYMTI
jgi:hypothetical protein